MGIITMDGYTFELIHKVQTTQNTLCIYKITREADSDPEYCQVQNSSQSISKSISFVKSKEILCLSTMRHSLTMSLRLF